MSKKIRPVGSQPKFNWSKPLDPSQVRPRDLPATAGVYVLIACDAKGNPITQAGEPATSQMRGVAYIGLTKKNHTLKKRVAQLARAWRPNSKQKKPSHGSRDHYNKDSDAQKLFKVKDVRIRFMPLPTDAAEEPRKLRDFAKTLGITTDAFRTMFGLQLKGDKHVEDTEANVIQWFKRQYGYIPILNRREEGAGDKPPSDAELKELLKRT